MGLRLFRALSIFVGVCGLIIYGINMVTWWGVGQQMDIATKPLLDQAWFVVDNAIFLSGLPPLILAIYFLILEKSARANRRGLIYVAIFIPIHYYVSATTAHSTPDVYIPAQLVEMIAAVLLIILWRRKAVDTDIQQ